MNNRNNPDGGLDTKLGIDATRPVSLPFAERSEVKKEWWDKLDLSKYLGSSKQ